MKYSIDKMSIRMIMILVCNAARAHFVEWSIGVRATRCECVSRLQVGLNHRLNVGLGDRGGRAEHGTTWV